MTLMKICFIIIFLTTLVKSDLEEKFCTSLTKVGKENTPIDSIKIKLWENCLKAYNTSRIHTISEIYQYLLIASRAPYGHIKVQNLTLIEGRARNTAITFMGNHIPYVNISIGSYVRKPAVVIVGGIFARDWLTVAASIFLIQELVLNFKSNYKSISKCSWIIIPVLNPDGYDLTLNDGSKRNWITNMRPVVSTPGKEECFGVNLYRNFEYQWINYDYTNISECSSEFSLKPFSEIESRSIKDTIEDNLETIKMFVTLIQKRRAFYYPFAFTEDKPLNFSVFENILMRSTQAAGSLYHRKFNYGHVLKFENKSAGGPTDWIKAHFQVEVAFCCEISSFQNNYYVSSTRQIKQTNRETFEALKTIASLGIDYIEGTYKF